MTRSARPDMRWIIDRRADMPPVGSQGMRRTCLAWAATTANEVRGSDRLSVEYLHWACGLPPNKRGTAKGLRMALNTKGQPLESQWPYSESTDDSAADYSPPASVTGPYYSAIVRRIRTDPATLADSLAAGQLPVVGLRITRAFLYASGGIVHTSDAGTDGHAVTVVGIAETLRAVGSVPGRERLICIRNSWGGSWGVAGHALVTNTAWSACAILGLVLEST
jgi:hypothetical protein